MPDSFKPETNEGEDLPATVTASQPMPLVCEDTHVEYKPVIHCTPSASNPLHVVHTSDWLVNEHISSLSMLELCAGSAVLSHEFRLLGFGVVPVDHKQNKHKQHVKCFDMDLTVRSYQLHILSLIHDRHFVYVHFAPPCGTASRARERPINPKLIRLGAPSPKPLRDASFPRGLPLLSEHDQVRVDQANIIYDFCVEVAIECANRGVIFSVENPRNSWFWTVAKQQATNTHSSHLWEQLETVSFQHCMYGSDRDKWSTWLCTQHVLSSLCVVCDKSHSHKPWSVTKTVSGWAFDTALEAEYPVKLCQQVAQLILADCLHRGAQPPAKALSSTDTLPKRLKRRVAAGALVKGRRLPPLLSEFAEIVQIPKDQFNEEQHKLLRQFYDRGNSGTTTGPDTCVVGVYRSMEGFVEEAIALNHPFDTLFQPLEEQKRALHFILSSSPQDLVKHRLDAIRHLIDRRKQLAADEAALHESLPTHLKQILKGKQLLLFKEILALHKYPDVQIIDDIIRGADIVGKTPSCPIYQKCLVPATLSTEELKSRAPMARKIIIQNVESQPPTEMDGELWSATMEERDKGWLIGPFKTEQEVTNFLDGDAQWNVCRRFPLKQRDKLRIIDDGKEGAINDALTITNKLELMDCDSLICLLRFIAETLNGADQICFQMEDGTKLEGKIHQAWRNKPEWLGRCLGLKSAYKQLGCSKQQLWASILTLKDPSSGRACFFASASLMFGASASVYFFNRAARALWFATTKVLHLLITNFYDDFPGIEPSVTAASSRLAFESMLDILGWKYAAQGSKAEPFEGSFVALGVLFDVSRLNQGSFIAGNKPARMEHLLEVVQNLLLKATITPAEAFSLAGQLFFAAGNCIGKSFRPVIAILQNFAVSGNKSSEATHLVKTALSTLRETFAHSKPRVFSIKDETKPIIIFTDGSFENGRALVGTFVIDVHSNTRLVFDGCVHEHILKTWYDTVGSQLITQIELWPVLCILTAIPDILANRRVIFFIDNDAARESLIKAYSPSVASMSLIVLIYKQLSDLAVIPWFARVPSKSNPADLPSREASNEACLRFNAKFKGSLNLPKPLFCKLKETWSRLDLL